MTMKWPFMLKSTHRAVQVENYTLRDALREANNELRKHRTLISKLKAGGPETTDAIMRAFERTGK